jgi:outer membrane receptor for Fe3+-dicitrate
MRQLMASRALAAVALLWVFAAGAATAQSAQSGTETLRVFLDEMVVTATRAPQPLDTQIRNTSILNKHDVEFVRHTHISELLNRLPGVNLHRNNGQESLTAIRSPVLTGGAGAGSFLYLEDGIPMRAAGFANVNGLFEAHTEQAGSIEVVRGPGSALYGSNAVHGLINVITPSASEPGARIDLSGGSFGRRRGKFSASGTHNGVGLFGSLTLDSEDGFRDEAGLDQQKLSLRADTEHGDDKFTFIVAAQNLNQETAGFVRGPDAYKDKDLVTTNPNPAAFRDARSVRASARWEHTVDANKKLAVTPYARWNEMDFILHFLPGGALEDSGHRSVGVQNTFYWDLDDGHRVVAGVDVEATDGYLKEIQSVPGFGSFPEGVHYNYDVFALVAAPYLHAEWMLMENVTLTTGARFEYTHYDYNNKTAADTIGRFKRPADRTDSYFAATPKVGFAWKTDEETSFYGN